MKGLSIDRIANCVKYAYLGVWKHKGTEHPFVIHVVKNRDDKPYVESLEWLEEFPDDEIDEEIIYHFAINHKYDI
jgi:hypothetical protein